jgi:hypothetical protein
LGTPESTAIVLALLVVVAIWAAWRDFRGSRKKDDDHR